MRRQVLVDKVTSLFSICTNYENCDWMNGRYIEHMQIVILKSKHPARFRNRPRNRLTVSIKLRQLTVDGKEFMLCEPAAQAL